MMMRVAILLALLSSPASASDCIIYETTVTLTGFYGSVLFPGEPEYTSVATGDAAELTPILFLEEPICTDAVEDLYDAVPAIAAIQLACPYETLMSLEAKAGTAVSVTGKLVGGLTGHHHTQVLLECADR